MVLNKQEVSQSVWSRELLIKTDEQTVGFKGDHHNKTWIT